MGENIVIAGVTFNDVPSIEVPKANGGIATYTLGSSTTVEPLSVTENGTYTAESGKAYSPVTVNVSGGGTDTLAELESNTLTSWTSTATVVGSYLFYNKTALTSVSYSNATSIGQNAFRGCTSLTSASFPSLTGDINTYAFNGCPLEYLVIGENFAGDVKSYALGGLSSGGLSVLDLKKCKTLNANALNALRNLNVLILRKTDSICTLLNTSAFNSTPFASGGTGGTLYVPQDLISSYQSASNWKTILGYANNQIKAIEGSIYE